MANPPMWIADETTTATWGRLPLFGKKVSSGGRGWKRCGVCTAFAPSVPRVRAMRVAIGEVDEGRLDPRAHVARISELQLREDRVDVLLHRALGEDECVGDVGVAAALGDQGQRLQLARGQQLEGGAPHLDPRAHQLLDDRRVD